MEANSTVQAMAQAYNAAHDLPAIVEGHYVPVCPTLAASIAQAYESMPVQDSSDATQAAYAALCREVCAQWLCILQHGYTLEAWPFDGQPYADSAAMCADVRNNKHLWYFTGGEVHPMLGSVNDLFRAVHDVFGHAAEGFQFGPRGEENAWLHHSQMFSPLAQAALTTETRGQNCWVNAGPYSHLPACQRPYAVQKCALLPAWACDWRALLTTASNVA